MEQDIELKCDYSRMESFLCANLSSYVMFLWLCFYVFVCVYACRMWAVTTALTQTQWRIVVESVWVMDQAVRRSIRRLMKEKGLVCPAQRTFEQLEAN